MRVKGRWEHGEDWVERDAEDREKEEEKSKGTERWKYRGRLARWSLRKEGWKQKKDTRRSGKEKRKEVREAAADEEEGEVKKEL